MTLINEATRRAKLRSITLKSEVKRFLVHEVRTLIVEDRKLVVIIRTDNAQEYEATKQALNNMRVVVEFSSTYTVYQNGVSKRFNQTVVTIARAMLTQSGLPLSFWAKAIVYACHVYNKLPTRGSTRSPNEQ